MIEQRDIHKIRKEEIIRRLDFFTSRRADQLRDPVTIEGAPPGKVKMEEIPTKRRARSRQFPIEHEKGPVGTDPSIRRNEITVSQHKVEPRRPEPPFELKKRPVVTIAPLRWEAAAPCFKQARDDAPHGTSDEGARRAGSVPETREKVMMHRAEQLWRAS